MLSCHYGTPGKIMVEIQVFHKGLVYTNEEIWQILLK